MNEVYSLHPKELKKQTLKYKTLNLVMFYLLNTWTDKTRVAEKLIAFYEKREELAYERKVLLWKNKVVIPETHREDYSK